MKNEELLKLRRKSRFAHEGRRRRRLHLAVMLVSLSFFILHSSFFILHAQSSAAVRKLEQERKAALEEIELTNKLLEEASASAKSSLNRLNLLSQQIASRKKVISLLTQEMTAIRTTESRCRASTGGRGRSTSCCSSSRLKILPNLCAECDTCGSMPSGNGCKLHLSWTNRTKFP